MMFDAIGNQSGDRRRAVLNGSQGGNLHQRGGEIARCGKAQKAERKLGKNRQRGHYGGGKDGVLAYCDVIAARTKVVRISFSGVLSHLQVIGYRDDWKQDQDDYRQSDQLHPPA